MKFLGTGEARRWVRAQGMDFAPHSAGVPMKGQLGIDSPQIPAEGIVQSILSVCERASQALLVIEDHPLSRGDRRERLIEFFRRSAEPRTAGSALICLFRKQDGDALKELLQICVGPGSWFSIYIYLAPISCTLLIWESSLIDVWSPRNRELVALQSGLAMLGAK